MNNNIAEDYCGFEVSKLLKEKGCNLPVNKWFDNTQVRVSYDIGTALGSPTHSLAIKWIRENFGINIHVHPCIQIKGLEIKTGNTFQSYISRLNHTAIFGQKVEGDIPDGDYRKPRNYYDSTEAGLLYTLKNLI